MTYRICRYDMHPLLKVKASNGQPTPLLLKLKVYYDTLLECHVQADRVSNSNRGVESNDPGRSMVPGEEKKKIEDCGASIPGSLQACWGERHHGTIGKREGCGSPRLFRQP